MLPALPEVPDFQIRLLSNDNIDKNVRSASFETPFVSQTIQMSVTCG
jgi:hypothetical protein